MQLMYLCALDDPAILAMSKKTDKYISAQIQNEIIQIMASHILRDIAKYFSIMADKVADSSIKEQFCYLLSVD